MTEKAAAQSIARQLRENAAWLRKGPTGLGDDVDPDSKRMAGLMEQAAALLSSPSAAPAGVKPVAFLVTSGRVFADSVYLTRDTAEASVAKRKDGSVIQPLYVSPSPAPAAGNEDAAMLDAGKAVFALRAAMNAAGINDSQLRADLLGFFCNEWNDAIRAAMKDRA